MGKVIKVTNGTDTFDVNEDKISLAVKDGFRPTERVVVHNSKTGQTYEVNPDKFHLALEDGFSFQDIVKKKDTASVPSGIGGKAGAQNIQKSTNGNVQSGGQSEKGADLTQEQSVRVTEKMKSDYDRIMTGGNGVDASDPAKNFLQPLRERKKEIFDRNIKVESTGQNKINKDVASKAVGDINEIESQVQKELFPNRHVARAWLQSNQDIKNNETSAIAEKIVTDDDNVQKAITDNNGDIKKSAVQYYSAQDNKLGEQLRIMQRDNVPIPSMMEGELVHGFLNTRTIREGINESQELNNIVRKQSFDFYRDYPDLRNKMLLGKIAKGREDLGYNNWFLNIPGRNSSDKIIKHLLDKGEITNEDVDFYNKHTRALIGAGVADVPTPGLLETTGSGIVNILSELPKSAYELTGLRDLIHSRGEILADNLQEDLDKTPEPKYKSLLHKVSSATGNLASVVIPIAGEAKLLQATNVLKGAAAAELSTGLTFYHDIQKAESESNPDNPLVAHLSALLQSMVWMKGSKVFGDLSKGVVKSASPEINDILKSLQKGEIDNAVAAQGITKSLIDKGIGVVEGSVSNLARIAGYQMINKTISDVLNGRFSLEETATTGAETFKHMMLGLPLLEVVKVAGSKNMTADFLDEIANNPESYKEQLKTPEQQKNFEYLLNVKSELEGRTDLTPEQKKKYQLASLREKILADKSGGIQDRALKPEKELKALEIEKQKILDPEMGNKRFIQEMYDADLLPKGSRMMLENEEGKFSESKVGEYLKFIAQQANNLDENWKQNEGKAPSMSEVPEQIIEAANERWADKIKEAQPENNPPIDQNRELDMGSEEITKPNEVSNTVSGDVTHEEMMGMAKTGNPISFPAFRIETGRETEKYGIHFGDKGVIDEYKRREDSGFYGEKNKGRFGGEINKYAISFKNPLVVDSKEQFIKDLAEAGDKEAQQVMPNYKETDPAKYETIHKSHEEIDEFVARKAKEKGYDGLITPLEYVALSKSVYSKSESPKEQPKQKEGEEGKSVGGGKPLNELEKIPYDNRTDAEHSSFIKQKFVKQFTDKGVPKEQVEAAVALMDARAKVSGKGDAWYRGIEDIGEGDFKVDNVQYQKEWKKILLAAAVSLQPLKTEFKSTFDKGNVKGKTEVFESTPKEKKHIEKIIKDYFLENNEEAPKEIIDRAIEVWEKFGKPVILPDSTSKNERAYGSPTEHETKTTIDTIGNITNFDDYVAEMSHAVQFQSGQPLSIGQYKSVAERDKYEYNREGSMEYDAHKLIEPYLVAFILTGKRGTDLTTAVMNASVPRMKEKVMMAYDKFKIYFQNNKGAVEFLQNGRKIIHALDAPDFSTAVHEIAHIFESDISPTERKVIQDWANTKDWNTETSEAFARGFERYLRDGNSPTPELKTIFQKAKEWLQTIYQKLVGSPIAKKITPEVKKVFDNLFKQNENIKEPDKGNEPIAPEKGGNITEPPNPDQQGAAEGEGAAGITHAANEIRRKDRLLPEYEKSPQTFEQWNNEAEKAIKEGYDVEKLMGEIEAGKDPNPVENAIRKIYIATLDAEIAKNPTDELLAKQKRFIEIGDKANSRAGRNLVSLKGEGSPLETISDFYVAKMEAAGVDKLTDKQKEETKAAFDKIQSADANATAAMEAYREEIAKLKAENELLKQKKSPKRKGDWAAQRKDAVEGAREALKKIRTGESGILGVPLPGVRELIAIAPHVKKYVQAVIGDGFDSLKEVVAKAYNEFKDVLEGITEKDIHNIIAGEYNEVKPTRNELSAKMRDLKDEAALINKLEKLLRGEEPKDERKKIERNKVITELRQKIKELKDELPPTDADLKKKLAAIKTRNEKDAEKIKERISKGDFETKKKIPVLEDPEMQKRFPKEYNAALDAVIKREEAQHEFDIALMRDELAKRSNAEKVTDFLSKTAGTAKAIVTGIDDSAVAVQTYMSLLRRPRTAVTALRLHAAHAASQKKFNRWLAALHSSSDYKFMRDAGLDITEPQSLKEREKEEIFNNRFSGTVKIKGKEYKLIDAPLKPFERAFTTLGNVTRVVGFRTIAEKYMSEGYTWEKDPELFKSLARRLNEQTGRGKQNEVLERASKIVTMGIWSPRLLSAKLNALGVSDAASLLFSKTGTKGYYRQLHPKERAAAIRDIAQFAVTVMAMSYGFALANGGTVDSDPESSTFLDVKLPNGKSVNFSGGFSSVIRTIVQAATGKKRKDGERVDANRANTLLRFFRGKTPPLTTAFINTIDGKDFMGKPTTVKNELLNLISPISVKGIVKQIQDGGAEAFFTEGIPTFLGFNIKDEKDYNKSVKTFKIKDPETFKEREVTKEEAGKYRDSVESEYEKSFKEIKRNNSTIWVDVNKKVHVSQKGYSKNEIGSWEEIRYEKLNTDQVKQVEKALKKSVSSKVKSDLFGEENANDEDNEKED